MIAPNRKSKAKATKRVKPAGRKEPGEISSSTLAFWAEEVGALSGMEYHSLDEAIDAVLSKVAARIPSGLTPEEASFLKQTLALDPEMKDRIVKLLKVKNG